MIDAITGLSIFSPFTVTVRLLAAMLAGFIIGYEREKHYQPAGLRTHMVLSMGAAVVMIISINLPLSFLENNPNVDPGRISAQVISGIGFLGAGAILRYGLNVKGLTTAASIWTTSGIGLAFGAGFYFLGFTASVLLVIILQVFDRIEDRIFEQRHWRTLTVAFDSRKITAEKIIKTVKEFNVKIKNVSVLERVSKGTTEVTISCWMDDKTHSDPLFNRVKKMGNIKTLSLE